MLQRQALRLAHMETMRRQLSPASMASRLFSAIESAGLATTATFASVLWVGLALPGLPLLPGLGASGNSNVAISLSSAVLGVQESQTFKATSGLTGRQARLLSLLLPADPAAAALATPRSSSEGDAPVGSLVVALPEPPATPADDNPQSAPRVADSVLLASAPPHQQLPPAPFPPAPPAPPATRPVEPSTPPRNPEPPAAEPPTSSTPPPVDPGVPAVDPQTPAGGDTPPVSSGTPSEGSVIPPASDPAEAGVGGGNPNAGGGNPNAGGGNPNAGGGNPNAGGGNPNAGGGNPNAGGGNPNAGGGNPNAGG
ncbi:MAG: hypothetical protein QOD85_2733, partial [Gaiellaceae bacterium]|nr:hypothetical protein [Gaiellaceae bacterium]